MVCVPFDAYFGEVIKCSFDFSERAFVVDLFFCKEAVKLSTCFLIKAFLW